MAATAFTTKDIQELRQRTGAGMMDAKKALEESNGNMDKAAEWLRAKGTVKAEKRAGKVAREGVVGSAGQAGRRAYRRRQPGGRR
jgi:elongation factor Ts